MRPRSIHAAGFLTFVLAACSQPADRDLRSDLELANELELAITKAEQPDPVASQIEIPRGESKKKAPPAKVRVAAQPKELPAVPEPQMELAPVATPSPEPITVVDAAPVTTPASGPSATVEEEPADDRRTEGRGTRPPIIIIRGGGSGDDPCDIHRRPGRGIPGHIPGVLINPRTPPFAGPDRMPPMSLPPRVGGGIRF